MQSKQSIPVINHNFMCIIMLESGRLGNQIHQLAALRLLAPKAFLLLIGFSELRMYLGFFALLSSRVMVISNNSLSKSIKCILKFLIAQNLVSKIEENRQESKVMPMLTINRLKTIAIAEGYFQSEGYLQVNSRKKPLGIHQKKVSEWLKMNYTASIKNLYFLHFRRGDYLTTVWGEHGNISAIPTQWYRDQAKKIRQINNNAFFIISSDDPTQAKEEFVDIANAIYAPGDEILDLELMSRCLGGGILSPSSYSLVAAFNVLNGNPDAVFIAPEYWVGWPMKVWYPNNIKMSWLKYSPVVPSG
jgi:hypothetical protein